MRNRQHEEETIMLLNLSESKEKLLRAMLDVIYIDGVSAGIEMSKHAMQRELEKRGSFK